MIFTLFTIITEMMTRNAKRKIENTQNILGGYDYDIETGVYKIDINFDEASREWKANKKSIGNGSYQYVCQKVLSTHRNCKKEACKGSEFCSIHKKETIHKIAEMV